jgi:hypothetical protein
MARKIKKRLANNILVLLLIFIVIYFVIYYFYVYPISRLHTLQTKEWISDFTDKIILGAKDRSFLYKISSSPIDNISFYYNYFFFHTKKYTIYVLENLNNKYSNKITLNVYLHNFETGKNELSQVILNMDDMKTSKQGDTLMITCSKSYIQKINMKLNTMELSIITPSIKVNFELEINDYTTNQPTFIPRFDNIKYICRAYKPITTTLGEWCSDNPMIGKVITCHINDSITETGGNFWFDNYIGVNDHFLSSYVWYVVLNDNWIIYMLWFGEYEQENKTFCFIIKDKRKNNVIRSGFGETTVPAPYSYVNNVINPIYSNYKSNNKLGDVNYDDYEAIVKTNEIEIKLKSIKGKSNQVFHYDYYKGNTEVNEKYHNVITNYKYVEYVNMVNIEIDYEGKVEKFEERCVVDAMYKIDKSIPSSV